MPFDRFVRYIDEWAGRRGPVEILAQIGRTTYLPRHLEAVPFLTRREMRQAVEESTAVVGHAGIGTILMALEVGKPILVVPRLARLGETRSDHQVATARYFSREGLVRAAMTKQELFEALDTLATKSAPPRIGGRASDALLTRIREFALGEAAPPTRTPR